MHWIYWSIQEHFIHNACVLHVCCRLKNPGASNHSPYSYCIEGRRQERRGAPTMLFFLDRRSDSKGIEIPTKAEYSDKKHKINNDNYLNWYRYPFWYCINCQFHESISNEQCCGSGSGVFLIPGSGIRDGFQTIISDWMRKITHEKSYPAILLLPQLFWNELRFNFTLSHKKIPIA